jgi:hypothetical protein
VIRTVTLALLASALGMQALAAQEAPWRYHWQKGQTLTYRADHVTKVNEVVEGAKVETMAKLNLVKQWKVVDVDPNGVATLELTLAALRTEQTRPNGESLLFDSANLDKSTPELRQMSQHVGKTLAIVRMDGYGRTLEVKQGSAAKYEAEPPFVVVLPNGTPKEGQAWLRNFNIVLEPPQGTGEKHAAQQRFTCTKIDNGKATVTLATELKALPENMQERLPLLQKEARGEVVFDIQAGRMQRVQLNIDRTVQNHQGEGSSYRFVSTYAEELVNNP